MSHVQNRPNAPAHQPGAAGRLVTQRFPGTWICQPLSGAIESLAANGKFERITGPHDINLAKFDLLTVRDLQAFSPKDRLICLETLLRQKSTELYNWEGYKNTLKPEEVMRELVGLITAWSPLSQQYIAYIKSNPKPIASMSDPALVNNNIALCEEMRILFEDMRPYDADIHRYLRQKVIQLFIIYDRGSITVPLARDVHTWDRIAPIIFFNHWCSRYRDQKKPIDILDNTAVENTNGSIYLSQFWELFPTNFLQRHPFKPRLILKQFYPLQPDISPFRFSYFLSSLRRVRLSAPVNEQFIIPLAVSFLAPDEQQKKKSQTVLRTHYVDYRVEQNILDMIKNYPKGKVALRMRLVGRFPDLYYYNGLNTLCIKGRLDKELPNGTISPPSFGLPEECPLVKEVQKYWGVVPLNCSFTVADTRDTPADGPWEGRGNKLPRDVQNFFAVWVHLEQPPTQEQIKFNEQNQKTSGGSAESTDVKTNTIWRVNVPAWPYSSYKNQLKNKVARTNIPLIPSIQLPTFCLDEIVRSQTFKFELAYKPPPHAYPPEVAATGEPISSFRGAILVEVVRIMDTQEMIQEVQRKVRLDPRPPEPTVHKCPVCGQVEKLFRCSACREIFYCSRDHQIAHWPQHRDTCHTRKTAKDIQMLKLKQTANNADVEIAQQSDQREIIPLECPLSLGRIQIPVRGLKCKHLKCFDLREWIRRSEASKASWSNCPHCNDALLFDELRISEGITVALEKNPNASTIVLNSGGWFEQHGDDRHADVSSSDDETTTTTTTNNNTNNNNGNNNGTIRKAPVEIGSDDESNTQPQRRNKVQRTNDSNSNNNAQQMVQLNSNNNNNNNNRQTTSKPAAVESVIELD